MTLVEAGPRMDSNSGVLGVQKVLMDHGTFTTKVVRSMFILLATRDPVQ